MCIFLQLLPGAPPGHMTASQKPGRFTSQQEQRNYNEQATGAWLCAIRSGYGSAHRVSDYCRIYLPYISPTFSTHFKNR